MSKRVCSFVAPWPNPKSISNATLASLVFQQAPSFVGLLFAFFLGFGIARADELSDAISALQAKYDSEIKALEAAKEAALGQARERYLADLSSAER